MHKNLVVYWITGTTGTGWAIAHPVFEDSLAQRVGWHRANLGDAAGILALLIVEEEKCPVLNYFASCGRTELVAHQRLPGNTSLIVEPGIRGGSRIPVIFVHRPVKVVRSAFGHECDLPSGGPPHVRALASHGDTEFLHGIQWNREHGIKPGIDICPISV